MEMNDKPIHLKPGVSPYSVMFEILLDQCQILDRIDLTLGLILHSLPEENAPQETEQNPKIDRHLLLSEIDKTQKANAAGRRSILFGRYFL